MERIAVLSSLVVCSLLPAGCEPWNVCDQADIPGGTSEGALPPEPVEVETTRRVAEILPVAHTAIDLLFVIDDSRSMTDEQEQLGRWSSEMFSVLSLTGELPDLHVAVISSSLTIPGVEGCERGGDGYFHTGGLDLGGDRFLRDVADGAGRARNYQGTLAEAFARMARVGELGCGFEQPFEAARRALSGEIPTNDGFLRDDALLLVVFVTDEDDCSMVTQTLATTDPYGTACSAMGAWTGYRCFEFGVQCRDGKGAREFGRRTNCRPDEDSLYIESVSSFVAFLEGLKAHPGQIVVAAIYGKPHEVFVHQDSRVSTPGTPRLRPACESSTASATPGIRINAFLAQFPARAAQSSICEPDLSWALRKTALLTRNVATRSPCLVGPIADANLDAAGIQPSCRAYSIIDRATPGETTTAIPPCAGDRGEDCFTIEADPVACARTASQLALRVRQSSKVPNETLTVECEVSPQVAPPATPR